MYVMSEIWKDIKNYERLYQVSNLGRIRSLDRVIESNIKGKIYYKTINGKVVNSVNNGLGYLQVNLCKEGKKKKKYVHVLVAEHFLQKPDGEILYEVNHKDHKKDNNESSNLEWVTKPENQIKRADYYGRVSYSCMECGDKVSDNKVKRCKKCSFINSRKVKNRPSKETLLELLRTNSFIAVGEMYDVSDNTIRFWLNQ